MNGSNARDGSSLPGAGATAEGLLPGYVRQRDPVFLEDVMRRYVSKRRVNARVNAELEEHVYGTPRANKLNEAEQKVRTWNATRAPADPWEAIRPLGAKK